MGTLDQEFQKKKEWIAGCMDVGALMDKLTDWRDDVRLAAREGRNLVRLRAGDLVELADDRLVELKAAVIRAVAKADAAKKAQKPSGEGADDRAARRQRDEREAREAREARDQADRAREDKERWVEQREHDEQAKRDRERRDAEQRERDRQAAEQDRVTAARLANAQTAKIEAEVALLKAQAVAAARATPTMATPPGNAASERRPRTPAPASPTWDCSPLPLTAPSVAHPKVLPPKRRSPDRIRPPCPRRSAPRGRRHRLRPGPPSRASTRSRSKSLRRSPVQTSPATGARPG